MMSFRSKVLYIFFLLLLKAASLQQKFAQDAILDEFVLLSSYCTFHYPACLWETKIFLKI